MGTVERQDFWGAAKATTLAADLPAAATALTVPAGDLATWGPVVAGRFPLIINRGLSDEEKCYGAAIAGDAITGITRGQDGTIAQDHFAGATLTHGLFAKHVDTANEFLSSPTAANQVAVSTGADTWGAPTATLNGITLVAPTIADLTNMPHDHLDADDAGKLTQAATHESPDTDSATTALHHTLGTGANQAAPGTHPAATATHGVGVIVGTTETQTLTNKTLTAPVLTAPVLADFTSAQHDHQDADDGGTLAVAAIPGLVAARTSYVPTITGSTTNPVFTYTTQEGRYQQVGKEVRGHLVLVLNAVTSAGSGTYLFLLPVAALSTMAPVGSAFYYDDSASGSYVGVAEIFDSTHVLVRIDGIGGGNNNVGATNPVAPGTADQYKIVFAYEAA